MHSFFCNGRFRNPKIVIRASASTSTDKPPAIQWTAPELSESAEAGSVQPQSVDRTGPPETVTPTANGKKSNRAVNKADKNRYTV